VLAFPTADARSVPERPDSPVGIASALTVFQVAMLLMVEGVDLYGLGTALDKVHPLLRCHPSLVACTGCMIFRSFTGTHLPMHTREIAGTQPFLLDRLVYWGLLLSGRRSDTAEVRTTGTTPQVRIRTMVWNR
jgi:hypothetical protein